MKLKKMSKMGKSILLSSLAILAFGGVAAGTTYALFTSNAETQISVSTGKVSVETTVDQDSVYTKEIYDEDWTKGAEATFNGSIEFDEGTVTLKNIVPGDAVKFDVKVSNKSTVTTKMRTVIQASEDDGVASGLKIKIGETEFSGVAISKWTETAVGSDDETVTIEIELPEDTENEYQDKSCTLKYSVEAVQGNAQTKDAIVVTPSTASKVTLSDNQDYYFAPGEYGDSAFYLHGKKNVSFIGTEGAHFKSFTAGYHSGQDGQNAKADSTFLIDGIKASGVITANVVDKSFEIKNSEAQKITVNTYNLEGIDLVVNSNTLTGNLENTYGVYICPDVTNYSLTVNGNTFDNIYKSAIYVQGSGQGSAVTGAKSIEVKNNTFNSYGKKVKDYAAFKIHSDTNYAPTSKTDLNEKATALAQSIRNANTFSEEMKGDAEHYYLADFYDKLVKFDLTTVDSK